jgi:hypothetical protein
MIVSLFSSINLPFSLVRNPLIRGALDTTLCDKVYQWLVAGRCFFPESPVSSTNKTDHTDITEILLKVGLTTITLTLIHSHCIGTTEDTIPIIILSFISNLCLSLRLTHSVLQSCFGHSVAFTFTLFISLLLLLCRNRGVRVMVFNTTFNNISVISWRSVLLVENTGVLGENHRPATSHWQPLSHNVVSSILRMS